MTPRPFSAGPAALHSVAVAVMVYGYTALSSLTVFDNLIRSQYGGHFQFLTIQGLAVACLTMTIGFLLDIFPLIKGLRLLKRSLFIVALPLSVVISSIYWSLLLFFPQLILQPDASESVPSSSPTNPSVFRIPLSVDLALHAAPALSLLADFLLFEPKYDKEDVTIGAPIAVSIFSLWYTWWVERCGKLNNGIFPYPFLTENTWETRIAIYAGATVLAFVSFWIINSFHPGRNSLLYTIKQ